MQNWTKLVLAAAVAVVVSACDSEGERAEPGEREDSGVASSPGRGSDAAATTGGAGDSIALDPDSPDSSNAPAVAGDTSASKPAAVHGQRYNVKSGIIEFQTGLVAGMRQTVYFDDFGRKEAIHATIESGGTSTRTVMIMANGSNIVYDPVAKVGTRMGLNDALSQLGLGGIPNLSELTEAQKRELKYAPIAGRTVLGKKAEGASINVMGTPLKVWTWEGVPLRMEASMKGQPIVVEATSLKTDVPVPAERFAIPKDVKLQELETGGRGID